MEGYPHWLADRTQLAAFIMIPITTGNVTSFTMIPIFDRFDVYEMYPDRDRRGRKTIIATARGSARWSKRRVWRVAAALLFLSGALSVLGGVGAFVDSALLTHCCFLGGVVSFPALATLAFTMWREYGERAPRLADGSRRMPQGVACAEADDVDAPFPSDSS